MSRRLARLMITVTLFALTFSCAVSLSAQTTRDADDLVPTGKGWGEKVEHAPQRDAKTSGGARVRTCPNGICYHGGPVMTGVPTIYYIWYGNWSGNTAVSILDTFIGDLRGSGYEHINTTYSVNGNNISGSLSLGASATDNYSQGTAFGDSGVTNVVTRAINSGGLPFDTTGIYFVLTSADVNETSGFCTQYCGWHAHGNLSTSKGSGDIKYAFVGNPDRCPSACEWQTTSPNGNSGADGMASIIAHEQEEAISDPDLNAWYDRQGAENADKCAWTFGSVSTTSNGAQYNFTGASGTRYLIQQNWVNASGGYCAMSY